jgi:hypothetical protein
VLAAASDDVHRVGGTVRLAPPRHALASARERRLHFASRVLAAPMMDVHRVGGTVRLAPPPHALASARERRLHFATRVLAAPMMDVHRVGSTVRLAPPRRALASGRERRLYFASRVLAAAIGDVHRIGSTVRLAPPRRALASARERRLHFAPGVLTFLRHFLVFAVTHPRHTLTPRTFAPPRHVFGPRPRKHHTTRDMDPTGRTGGYVVEVSGVEYATSVDEEGCLLAPGAAWADGAAVRVVDAAGIVVLRGVARGARAALDDLEGVRCEARRDADGVRVVCLRTTADRAGLAVVRELTWAEAVA